MGLTLLAVAAKTTLFTVWKLITCQYLQLKNMVRRLFVCFPCLTAVLCCAVLCCAVLCCAVLLLCCAVLCCAVLCCAVLCCAVLCCAVLCCAVLCCAGAVLCCAVLCCAVLCCAVLCCAVLCCAVLCCTANGLKPADCRRRWAAQDLCTPSNLKRRKSLYMHIQV